MEGYKWDAIDYACNASAQYDWATELIEKLKLQGNQSLLDIGCGDGRISAELAKSLKKGSVVGIDASKEMIAVAKNHYPLSGYSNLSFAQMDARSIRLGKRFDKSNKCQLSGPNRATPGLCYATKDAPSLYRPAVFLR